MIPKDLYQKVRKIQIVASRLVTDVFAGQYHSVFKGRGMEFDEVREYQVGDDIRTIDWNVTARTGKAHVKKFVEERELTVMLLLDASGSCRFASAGLMKSRLAAEIAALLAFSAIRNNDKVGLIIFTDTIEKFIPPRKGVTHVLRVIREALYHEPLRRATSIPQALGYLSRVTPRKTVSFLISDFLSSVPSDAEQQDHSAEELKKALAIANKRHDLIAVTLNDPREQSLTDCGLMTLQDAETGALALVDTTSPDFRARYARQAVERMEARKRLFQRIGIDQIDVSTDRPYSDEMVKFFLKRRKRRF